jgi:hypothetical protein
MIHGNDEPYISFVVFHEGDDVFHEAPYANIVREGFSKDGGLMLTKRNLELALTDQVGKPVIAV